MLYLGPLSPEENRTRHRVAGRITRPGTDAVSFRMYNGTDAILTLAQLKGMVAIVDCSGLKVERFVTFAEAVDEAVALHGPRGLHWLDNAAKQAGISELEEVVALKAHKMFAVHQAEAFLRSIQGLR